MTSQLLPRRHDYCNKHCPLFSTKVACRHVPTEVVQRNADGGIDLAFVAEAPGADEDQIGRPLIGRSGQLLRKILKALGDTGIGYSFSNICRCRPTTLVDNRLKDRPPTPAERTACLPYLWEDLRQLKPKQVVALGATAISAFIPRFKSVAETHGREVTARVQGFAEPFKILPTYHPAAVLHDGSLQPYLKEDLARALGKTETAQWNRPGHTKALLTLKEVKRFVVRLLTKLTPEHIVSFDVETTSTERLKNRLLCIAFAYDDTTAYAIPYDHPDAPWSPKEFRQLRKLLCVLFTHPRASFGYWCAHHSSFDSQVIRQNVGTFLLNRPVLDSEWLFFGLDESRLEIGHPHPYALKQLLIEYLEWDPYDPSMLKLRSEGRMLDAKLPRLLAYNGTDCYATVRLVQWIKQRAGDYWPKLLRLAAKLMAPGQLALNQVELNGFAVDVELLQMLCSKHTPLQQHLADAEAWFHHYQPAKAVNAVLAKQFSRGMETLFGKVPWVFSLRKQEHLIPLFIDALKLKPINTGKRLYQGKPAPKIDKKFLATYKDHEAIQHLKTYRDLDKLMSSYVKSILKFLRTKPDCNDGRIRSNFLTTRTLTGRLASRGPNLQQIPRRSDEKDALQAKTTIKNMFCASPGWALVSADYMQGEVYLLAQVSRDKKFCALLWRIRKLMNEYERHPSKELADRIKNDGDVHRQTAALMFNVPVAAVTKEMRQLSKSICVTGDTLVPTRRGLIPIKDLSRSMTAIKQRTTRAYRTREYVATDRGVRQADQWFEHDTNSTYRMTTQHGYRLHGTGDHPVMVLTPDLELVGMPLNEIEPGSYVALPKAPEVWAKNYVNMPILSRVSDLPEGPEKITCRVCGVYRSAQLRSHLEKVHQLTAVTYRQRYGDDAQVVSPQSVHKRMSSEGFQRRITFPRRWPKQVDEKLGELLGYLVSEGSPNATLSNSDPMLLRHLRQILWTLFGRKVWSEGPDKRNSVRWMNLPAYLQRTLEDLGYSRVTAAHKQIPWAILQSPRPVVVAFLRAYFAGDGSADTSKIRCTSASHQLIKQLQVVLANFGILASTSSDLRLTPVGREWRKYWTLIISGVDRDIFLDQIGSPKGWPRRVRLTTKGNRLEEVPFLKTCLQQELARCAIAHAKGRAGTHYQCTPPYGSAFTLIRWEHTWAKEYTFNYLRTRQRQEGSTNLALVHRFLRRTNTDLDRRLSDILRHGYRFDTVAKVQHIRKRTRVYDIRVPGRHWFITNGLVSHNCFGIIYGKHVSTLAKELNITEKEATKKSDLFFAPFRDARRWLDGIEKFALKYLYVESELGRRRRFNRLLVVNQDPRKQTFTDRSEMGNVARRARNSPIQSLLSDIALYAAGRLQQYIWRHHKVWRLVDIVHDAIIAEVPVAELPRYTTVTKRIMTDLTPIERDFEMKFYVPMNVDFEVGTHYGQLVGLSPGPAGLKTAMKQITREWQYGFATAATAGKDKAGKEEGCSHDAAATHSTHAAR